MKQGAASLEQLLAGLAHTDVEIDTSVRKGTVSRYRSFATAVGDNLCGQWAYEDTHASYILLDGVALGDDTPRLARYLLEDFQHYASSRKPPDRRALLIVDEFSALRVPGAAALLERLRSFGVGVVIASQSVEGLHDDPGERARLLGAASTVIAHRLADPELIAGRAGTVQRAERSHQLDHLGATGLGSLRIQETYRIDPNDLRNLPAGAAWITTAGRAAKVAVSRGGQAPNPTRTGGSCGDPGVLGSSPRRGHGGDERVRRGSPRLHPSGTGGFAGDPAVGRRTRAADLGERGEWACMVVDGLDEISFVEARLPSSGGAEAAGGPERPDQPRTDPSVEQQTLPIDETSEESLVAGHATGEPPFAADGDRAGEFEGSSEEPRRRVSPYAEGL
jgi:hypothetical protein